MHICISKVTTIGSDNGLSPGRGQAVIWTNAGILLIGPLGTTFSEILIEFHTFSFRKMHLNMWWPFCPGMNVSTYWCISYVDICNSRKNTVDVHFPMLVVCGSESHHCSINWLTHWDQNKITVILHIIFSNSFSLINIIVLMHICSLKWRNGYYMFT